MTGATGSAAVPRRAAALLAIGLIAAISPAAAHGPLFSASPHTPFKGAVEIELDYNREKASGAGKSESEREVALEIEYGITADWEVGVELPHVKRDDDGRGKVGIGDVVLGTKYRFLRHDSPGAQTTAGLLFKVKLPSGDDDSDPRLGTGSTDFTGGLTGGYESRRWYAFADAIYRLNTEGGGGLEKGDRQFLDLVGGVRPMLTGYLEPDTVLFLELNWENANRDRRNGVVVADTGGWEMFVSPGIFWTYRQLAVRTGVQIPLAHNLNGVQARTDYRFTLQFEHHF